MSNITYECLQRSIIACKPEQRRYCFLSHLATTPSNTPPNTPGTGMKRTHKQTAANISLAGHGGRARRPSAVQMPDADARCYCRCYKTRMLLHSYVTPHHVRAVGRSSGAASGSWVTSTHVPGRSLRASPAVVQPGRTDACTRRTDKGAYLKEEREGGREGGRRVFEVEREEGRKTGRNRATGSLAE